MRLAELPPVLLQGSFDSQHESVLKFIARGWAAQAGRSAQALVRSARELEYRRQHPQPPPPVQRCAAGSREVRALPVERQDYSDSGF